MSDDVLESPRDGLCARRGGVLVLGLGNDILSDDAVGLHVARALRERLPASSGCEIVELSEMGLSLLDFLVGFDEVILVDAVQTGKAPVGFIHQIEGEELEMVPARSPHRLGVSEMLALGLQLGLPMPARVRILAVEVADLFTVSNQFSSALAQVLPSVVLEVANLVVDRVSLRSGH